MLVEKYWYNYSTADLQGDRVLLNNNPRGVPFVLDFAVGNTSCPTKGQKPPPGYACVNGNSYCANATNQQAGYVCKCLEHYDGNPYITNGCQDIDECKQPNVYHCFNGDCKNRLGGYDWPCKFGMKGDGKEGTCTDLFPPAAKVTTGAIGSILMMAVVSFLIILLKERRKAREFYLKNAGPLLEQAKVIKIFTKEEIKAILKSSIIIGQGGFGEVHKGLLDNKEVVVKKPIRGSLVENKQLANDVIIQSKIIHKNILTLIGCCLEVDTPMLVYEFISNGSLHEILHGLAKVPVSLDDRLTIATQSAYGLAYTHAGTDVEILHGDVKPGNILLDDKFSPKISDFGLSRLMVIDKQQTELVIGDMSYMDPVFQQKGLLTQKSDVYSFGVVILELISRRKATHSDNNNLVNNLREAHEQKKKATVLFDQEIALTKDLELLDRLAGLAMECLSLEVDQRPTMTEVAERLLMISRSRPAIPMSEFYLPSPPHGGYILAGTRPHGENSQLESRKLEVVGLLVDTQSSVNNV